MTGMPRGWGAFGGVKPALKPQADVDYLWEHLDEIDVVESDHAPHTREEKKDGSAPFGMPGLETTLALMLQAERDGRLSRDACCGKWAGGAKAGSGARGGWYYLYRG